MTRHNAIRRAIFAILALAASLSLGSREMRAQKHEVRIAAAADLQFAMSDLVHQFERATGDVLHATYGSSGNFFSQLQNGAPFDLFFSADIEYPRKLQTAGLVEPGSLFTLRRRPHRHLGASWLETRCGKAKAGTRFLTRK